VCACYERLRCTILKKLHGLGIGLLTFPDKAKDKMILFDSTEFE